MSKNLITPNMDKFATFIFSWGRPDFDSTYKLLRKCGYTGRVVFLCDDLDDKHMGYIEKYGNENVYVFSKYRYARKCDPMNNFGKLESTLYVENAMFDIANELGID